LLEHPNESAQSIVSKIIESYELLYDPVKYGWSGTRMGVE